MDARKLKRLVRWAPALLWFALLNPSSRGVETFFTDQVLAEPEWTDLMIETVGKTSRTFTIGQSEFVYFYSRLNQSWAGERSVEVAIGLDFLQKHRRVRVLEVGNVMSQYWSEPRYWTVLDKYEESPGVINSDVVDCHFEHGFDAILSISTLEHVGFDETPVDPSKFSRALRHLASLLNARGELLFTVPTGYNPAVEQFLRSEHPEGLTLSYAKRLNWINEWREVPAAEALATPYGPSIPQATPLIGHSFPLGNALVIGRMKSSKQ